MSVLTLMFSETHNEMPVSAYEEASPLIPPVIKHNITAYIEEDQKMVTFTFFSVSNNAIQAYKERFPDAREVGRAYGSDRKALRIISDERGGDTSGLSSYPIPEYNS